MQARRLIGRIAVLWVVAAASPGLSTAVGSEHQTAREAQRFLADGRVVIMYKGGTYVGHIIAHPETAEPLWHGRCAFHFTTGAVFEGLCADGRFSRGFLRSVDGRSIRFLDVRRSDAQAIRRAKEEEGL